MRKLLEEKYGFNEIRMLNEDPAEPENERPTKKNILEGMRWLVDDCMPGDALVLHYSGHGVQRKDKNGDELTGMDDALVPLDFKKKGLLVDDEINEIIVRKIPTGVRLHAIMDCCHSGTMLDLEWVWNYPSATGRANEDDWYRDVHPQFTGIKGTNGGHVIAISGCDDDQESADTNAFGDHRQKQGAMTYSLVHAIELGLAHSYFELITSMRALLQRTLMPEEGIYPGEEDREIELNRLHEFIKRRLNNPVKTPVQIPQLTSAGPPINLHEPFTFGYHDSHHSDHPHVTAQHVDYRAAHEAKLEHVKAGNFEAFTSKSTRAK